jgi:hypothetical protein
MKNEGTNMRKIGLGVVLGVAAWLAAGGPALAAPESRLDVKTAGDLADLCAAPRTDPTGPEQQNFCHGYAQGALVMELQREASIGRRLICLPTPAPTREATMAEFVKWTRAIPKNQSLSATDGLFTFLSQRFPCNK